MAVASSLCLLPRAILPNFTPQGGMASPDFHAQRRFVASDSGPDLAAVASSLCLQPLAMLPSFPAQGVDAEADLLAWLDSNSILITNILTEIKLN